METRQLKYFLDVANCLNFTKAAQINHMAQTTMSQNINSLEIQLGFKLFERNNRNVRLTEMGEIFYPEAVRIIKAAEQSQQYISKVLSGHLGRLRIGFQGEHEMGFLPGIVKKYRKLYPEVSIEFEESTPRNLENLLDNGSADVIFTLNGELTSEDNEEYTIEKQLLCVVTPSEHRFTKYDIIPRSLVAEEKMVFFAPSCSNEILNIMLHEDLQGIVHADMVTYAPSLNSLLLMVECGIGISLLPTSCDTGLHDVRFIELEGEKYIRIVARWKNDNSNQALKNFINLIKAEFPGR
ncbi:MAG: LysR family transcriptional regulator [Parasporobacterium sp.]|nr:LysR family transcriptional regulator [Parasporobacterium sp.]